MSHDRWRMGFHLMPPTGWLNDPNGLCQLNGTYHVFHQYSPEWPAPGAARGWGHAVSDDLVHWRHLGMAIAPDTPDETSGAYSGCAVPWEGGLRLYYTGNVKEPGDYDYVRAGRRSVQILVESPDGRALGEKHVVLRNASYPSFCTCHVRDPKVWRSDDAWWMLLGARDLDDRGLALLMRSIDGVSWESAGTVRSDGPLGYMWECPDRIMFGDRAWLSLCPQGMQDDPLSGGLHDVTCYLPLPAGEKLEGAADVTVARADARLWDHGFDFYAPQTFVDESGRTLLVAWMGMPDAPYDSAPDGLAWCHCLTVPRELSAGEGGALLQRPVPELDALRGAGHDLRPGAPLRLGHHRADVVVRGSGGPLALTLDGALHVRCADGELSLSFADERVGAGRTERVAPCGDVRELRVLVDSSAVEVYANDGQTVLSTRWFPRADALEVALTGEAAGSLWEMGDGMAGTYEA
ncbi:glycoside hydrolase family 32 protein [Olsenella profusa]|uniref:beta-fructofuranosidase n=1 Tax=Olsenella profusa TaxID=138595 RepID=A0ABS2F2B2_9ACTN|nr:glycoside hydrolase family 32 protein [Olsenella profusa]MBM6775131.1 glycoside hydrolase family 32 protein [Olsenella profusa]